MVTATGSPAMSKTTRPGHDRVVSGRLRAVGEVELALDETLRALPRRNMLRGVFSIHLDQPPAHHGLQVGSNAPCRQRLFDRFALIRLDIDDESVGRIRRTRATPGVDQVGPRDGEEQQRHDAG